MLSERKDDDGGKQRPYSRTAIATHLEDGLSQTLVASRCHLCHSRSSRMKHGRSQPYDAHRQENQKIIFGEGQQEQAHQCEAHADGKSIGTGMLVGIKPCEWLQDRRRHLEDQRDDTYLCKREVELILHNRIDGRDNRLNHIVQEMGNAQMMSMEYTVPSTIVGFPLILLPIDLMFIFRDIIISWDFIGTYQL